MRILAVLALAALPAWAQPVEGLSDAQRADYRKLMASYRDTFRILGRSRICRLDFDAEPFFREVARRHGEKSEPMTIARLSFTAGAENLQLSREIDPTPSAPMPCDVMVYMRGMQLPEVPASLKQ